MGINKEWPFKILNLGLNYMLSPLRAREGEHFYRGKKEVGRATAYKDSLTFHWLSPALYSNCPQAIYFNSNICFNATLSIHPNPSFPHCVHTSALYVCDSVPALQISSPVTILLYSIYLHASIYNIYFSLSDLLTFWL